MKWLFAISVSMAVGVLCAYFATIEWRWFAVPMGAPHVGFFSMCGLLCLSRAIRGIKMTDLVVTDLARKAGISGSDAEGDAADFVRIMKSSFANLIVGVGLLVASAIIHNGCMVWWS
jgi:hypothetical protein